MKAYLPTILFFLLAAFICSCTKSNSSTVQGEAADSSVWQGEILAESTADSAKIHYANYCSGCHGEKAVTFADRKWKFGNNDEDLFKSIKFGHPNAGMPAFENTFSDEEIENLVSYIRKGIQEVDEYRFDQSESLPDTFRTEQLSFTLDTIASGMQKPWGMAFLPNDEMLITETSGILYRLNKDKKLEKIIGVPEVLAQGQGGLLDVVLHPEFEKNKFIYLSYSAIKKEGDKTLSTTAIMRAKLEGNQLVQQKKIFEALPYSEKRHHYGSRMVFGKDGLLYFSVGDRGNHDENPQSLNRHPGKIHRIKDDGSIPSGNPFVGEEGDYPSTFSYGHRNPQGLAFHPQTGELWEHEHGPRGGDEINVIQKGENYGWPVISYGINYDGSVLTDKTEQEEMEQPILYWVPSIAPSGMAFVTGNRYKGWEGSLLTGALRFKYLNRTILDGNKVTGEEKLLKNIGRLRDVRMSPDGFIYVAVENPGYIFKLVPVE